MRRNKIFVSYSHRDAAWLREFMVRLRPLVRESLISVWSDNDITPGAEWLKTIKQAVLTTKVAVFLLTPEFVDSKFIREYELKPLLAQAPHRVTICWIPIHICAYESIGLEPIQAVCSPDRPLAAMRPAKRNYQWKDICRKIRDVLESAHAPTVPFHLAAKLIIDLEQMKRSEFAPMVLDELKREPAFRLKKASMRPFLKAAIKATDAWHEKVAGMSLGMDVLKRRKDSWQDFPQVATPLLVGVARSLEPADRVQDLVGRLCMAVARHMGAPDGWHQGSTIHEKRMNAVYRAARRARNLESDQVFLRLRRLLPVGDH